VVFFAHVSWPAVIRGTLLPHVELTRGYLMALVAVLGTTISPYLFFWQASQEVEEVRNNRGEKPLKRAQAQEQLGRIRVDTYLGMALSNLVAFFIILSAAATLHAHGIAEISTSAQAAKALEPLAGPRRPFCVPFVCLRYRRHRVAGGSSAGGVGLLWNWRGLPMENES
jgi:Mn2+/Fe2+ NRAMP family transporter